VACPWWWVHALSAETFVLGWAALECGTLTIKPASWPVREYSSSLRGWEWKSGLVGGRPEHAVGS